MNANEDYPVKTAEPVEKRLPAELFAELRAFMSQFPGLLADGVVDEPPPGLSRYVANAGPSFSKRLQELIRGTGEPDSAIYGRAGIDRRHFSKIRSDPSYAPKKTTVIAFILALRLTYAQADELLRLAGYALSRSSKFDLIIRYFIERGIYDPAKINDALYDFGQPVLDM